VVDYPDVRMGSIEVLMEIVNKSPLGTVMVKVLNLIMMVEIMIMTTLGE
jgi:hypothetical protein